MCDREHDALDLLWSRWPSREGGHSNAAFWDASAAEFNNSSVPVWGEDAFLEFIAKDAPLDGSATVLDIGCGTGVYSLALAEKAKSVVGVDISAKMIAYAREKAAQSKCCNVSFAQGDFRTMDIQGPFDIVIAHLTPAVCDGETFKKMMGLAARYCAFAKPTRRTDSVLDALRELVGGQPANNGMDDDFLKAFSAVWLSGKTPTVESYPDVWRSSRPLEAALDRYGKRLAKEASDEESRARIEAYLEKIAVDGIVREVIVTTVMMMGWRV